MQYAVDDLRGFYAGEPRVEALELEAELLVVDAHEVQDGGVQVADMAPVYDGFVAEFVGFTISSAAFDSGAGHEVGESFGIVIASIAALADRLAAELSAPDDEGFVEQTALLQVGKERGNWLVDLGAMDFQVFLDAIVGVPVLLLMAAALIDLDEPNTSLDQAAGDETLAAKRSRTERERMLGLWVVQAVQLFGGSGLSSEIKRFRGGCLKLKGQFVAGDAGLQLGVARTRGKVLRVERVGSAN